MRNATCLTLLRFLAGAVTRPGSCPERFLRELEAGTDVRNAATLADVTLVTVYREHERNPEFAQRIKKVDAECVRHVEAALREDAKSSPAAARFLARAERRQRHIDEAREEGRRAVIQELRAKVNKLPREQHERAAAALPKQRPDQSAPRQDPCPLLREIFALVEG